mgnify:CR=1 FL=1
MPRTRYDLASVRICTGGGESLGAETYRDWKAMFGLEIYEGLGTTEMMYVFASSAVTRRVKPGAIGPAVPGTSWRSSARQARAGRSWGGGILVARGPTGRPLLAGPGPAGRGGAGRLVPGRRLRDARRGRVHPVSVPRGRPHQVTPGIASGPRKWRRPWPSTGRRRRRRHRGRGFRPRPAHAGLRGAPGRADGVRARSAASSSSSAGTGSPSTSGLGRSRSCRSCRGRRGQRGRGPASSCAGSSASRPSAPEGTGDGALRGPRRPGDRRLVRHRGGARAGVRARRARIWSWRRAGCPRLLELAAEVCALGRRALGRRLRRHAGRRARARGRPGRRGLRSPRRRGGECGLRGRLARSSVSRSTTTAGNSRPTSSASSGQRCRGAARAAAEPWHARDHRQRERPCPDRRRLAPTPMSKAAVRAFAGSLRAEVRRGRRGRRPREPRFRGERDPRGRQPGTALSRARATPCRPGWSSRLPGPPASSCAPSLAGGARWS